MYQAIHFGHMTVQWNRAKPPRVMGLMEFVIRMTVYHWMHLLFCCTHPIGTVIRFSAWAVGILAVKMVDTTEAGLRKMALIVDAIEIRER